jgi:transglutaminase-like putative cysteine protease
MQIIKESFKGAPHTAQKVVQAALMSQGYYVVRQMAEDICREIRSKDTLSDGAAIYHFVQSETRYMRDPRTIELVKAPYHVCDQLRAGQRPALDCDDYAALIAALMLSVGAPARVVTVAFQNQFYKGERQYSHIFAQFAEPKTGTWVTLDPVAGENTQKMLSRVIASKIYPVA